MWSKLFLDQSLREQLNCSFKLVAVANWRTILCFIKVILETPYLIFNCNCCVLNNVLKKTKPKPGSLLSKIFHVFVRKNVVFKLFKLSARDSLYSLNGFYSTGVEQLVKLYKIIIKKWFHMAFLCSEEQFEVNNRDIIAQEQLSCLREKVRRN